MDVFCRVAPGSRHWQLDKEEVDERLIGRPSMVREQTDTQVTLPAMAGDIVDAEVATSFLEVLEEWGHGWMWRSLRMQGFTCSDRRLVHS